MHQIVLPYCVLRRSEWPLKMRSVPIATSQYCQMLIPIFFQDVILRRAQRTRVPEDPGHRIRELQQAAT